MTTYKITQLLANTHVSPETAYLVADYPYGFTLRCQIRYWIEYRKGHGFRFCSQTTNPKRPGIVWNKPKAGTYCPLAMALYLDDVGHVQHAALPTWADPKESADFLATFGPAIVAPGTDIIGYWIKRQEAIAAAKAKREAEGSN